MTLGELIERLQEIEGECGADVEVQLMVQPNYPLIHKLAGITSTSAMEMDEDDSNTPVIYLCQGDFVDYGSGSAWESMI